MTKSAPPAKKRRVDQLLTKRGLAESRARAQALVMAGLVFAGDVKMGVLCSAYGVPFEPLDAQKTLGEFLAMRLGMDAVPGDRVRLGPVELVVNEIQKGIATKVGLELEAPDERLPVLRFLHRLRDTIRKTFKTRKQP